MKKQLSNGERIIIKGLPKAIEALERKSKTPRGLTLQESLALDELKFMGASGFSDPHGMCYQSSIRANNSDLLVEIKSGLRKLNKDELINELALAKLKIEDLESHSIREENIHNFLLAFFDGRIKKRTGDRNNRDAKRKEGKAAIHEKRFHQAQLVYNQMLNEFSSSDFIDNREFYRRLDSACLNAGLGIPSINTRRNYFKKLSGIISTN